MLVEPQIPRSTILQLLSEHYQLDSVSLEFIPKGECSWNYKVQIGDEAYFLKIHGDTVLPLERFDLLSRMYEQAHIEEILHPIKTKNDKSYVFLDSYPVVLFPYVDGKNGFEMPFPGDIRFRIGEVLAHLHQLKNVGEDYPVIEDFIFPYKQKLKELLEITESKNEYQKEVGILLHKNKQQILHSLQVLESLGEKIRRKNPELVICHGDIHDGNILLDKDGKVHIIDWDDLKLCPKEKDLNYVKDFTETMRGYQSVLPETVVDQEIIEYYGARWTLSEIYDWSNRILSEEHEDIENKRFLEGLEKEIEDLL